MTKKTTTWIIVGVIVLIVLSLVGGAVGYYNMMVGQDTQLSAQNAQVQNVYERRAQLIPQIAAVVKKYVAYEQSTLTGIVALRTASTNLDSLNAMIQKGDISSTEFSSLLSSTLNGLKVTVEAYPDLKADTQFQGLTVEIE